MPDCAPPRLRVRVAPDESIPRHKIGGTLSVITQLTARKSVAAINQEIESAPRLNRVLGPVTLTSVGLGAMIGTGIFVLTGTVAAQHTGPVDYDRVPRRRDRLRPCGALLRRARLDDPDFGQRL